MSLARKRRTRRAARGPFCHGLLGRRREDRGEPDGSLPGDMLLNLPCDEMLDVLESVDRVPLTYDELSLIIKMAIQLKSFGTNPATMLCDAVTAEAALIRLCGRDAVRDLTFDPVKVLDGRPIDFARALDAPSFRSRLEKLMAEAAAPLRPEWPEGYAVPTALAENEKAEPAAVMLRRLADVFLLKTPNLRKAVRGDAMRDWMIASWLDVPFEREKERYALLSKVLGLDRGTLQNRAREVRAKAGEPKRKRGRPRKSRTSEDGR